MRPLSLIAPLLTASALAADEPAKPVSFKDQVAPILVRKCLGCHNDMKAESGLNMKTFALLRKGGKMLEAGILEPGDPEASFLIESIRPGAEPRMPYKLPPLCDAEIKILEDWVRRGAKFDGGSESETFIASLVDPLKDLPKVAVKVPTADPITSTAFTPDGKALITAQGRSVLVLDPRDGKQVAKLDDHPGPVTAVRITPDGKALVAVGGRAGMFGSIVIWDLETKARRHDLRGHADGILSASISPDGKTLATAGYDRMAMLWDLAEGRHIRTLKEHTDAVHSVAFSPDGKALATASADRTVKVWDVATGTKRVTLSDSTAELYAVVFAPDGATVLAAGVDRSIRAWKLDGDRSAIVGSAFAHDAPVLRLVLAPDGKTLVSSAEDKAVKIWDFPALRPRATFGGQSDWPLALSLNPDGSRLAVGRYDGSLALLDPATGNAVLALRDPPGAAPPPKPELARNPTLNPPAPRGGVRGSKLKVNLSGEGVGSADAIVFNEPGIAATILTPAKPEPNRIEVELTIPESARIGLHRFGVRTALGTPPFQTFAVSAHPEAGEAEPNDDPAKAKAVALPATLIGAIERPGEVDHFLFDAKGGQTLVFEAVARALGSGLNGTLAVLDEAGKLIAEARDADNSLDPLLTWTAPGDGTFTLRVVDADFAGSGNHFYRIHAGGVPQLGAVYPLGVAPRTPTPVALTGANLGADTVVLATEAPAGTILPVLKTAKTDLPALNDRSIAVAEGTQSVESEGNDQPAQANKLDNPGGASGRIDKDGDVDHFSFEAKAGERVVLEIFGRRLGTPIDPVIEVLDANGKPVPRAVLRPVAETAVAFRDHPSGGRNIRLTQWNDFAVNDYVLMGRELMRLFELPRNPDDDAVFWGLGNARNNTGERTAFLETTPEHHPQGQAIYKVEVHPPGATFPSGGVTPVTLFYRNDDGGPGLGKDARVLFDPPADGRYLARVEDARGLGGERFGYHLVARPPKPDFKLALSTENPNVPRGGTAIVIVSVTRVDGFDGPVDVSVEGLPPGIRATGTRIEAGVYAAELLLMADESAPAVSPPTWQVIGRAQVGASPGDEVSHELDPGGKDAGWVTVTPKPDLKIAFSPDRIELRPGERVELTLKVERNPAFGGRVPIDVHNLPRGVRVLNIGLNGVLVTEAQTERTVFLYAEPWVEPLERPFFAAGRLELLGKAMGGNGAPVIGSSREHSSPPIPLVVRPARPGPEAAASASKPAIAP